MEKRGCAHGGHGWFVAFTDLMALLMSAFVMIAAYSTQDQKEMQMVAGSVRDAFGVNKDPTFAGIIESQGLPTADHVKYLRDVPDDRFASVTVKADTEPRFPDNPFIAANRRVTATLLKDAPPTPVNKRFP